MNSLRDNEIFLMKRKNLESYVIENQKYLYRIAFTYMKNRDDSLEVVQNTIYKALNSVKYLKDIELIKPWVTRILINNCMDLLKKNKKNVLVDEVLESKNFQDDDSNKVINNMVLKRSMEALPLKLKSIIILRYFEDIKIKDIAIILNMNENTVKTNLYKALKILKLDLGEVFVNG